jgi:hypothetical protein
MFGLIETTPAPTKLSDATPKDRSILRFYSYLTMGGFNIYRLTDAEQQELRRLQHELGITLD